MSEPQAAPQVEEPFPLSTLRHSVSHLMASAVAKLFPGARFGFGPSIEHGFVISNRVLVMQRWLVRSEGPLNGRTVGEVVDTYGLNIVEHRPVGEEPILIPSLKTKLKAGDGVVVQGPFEVIAELKKQTLELIERA